MCEDNNRGSSEQSDSGSVVCSLCGQPVVNKDSRCAEVYHMVCLIEHTKELRDA